MVHPHLPVPYPDFEGGYGFLMWMRSLAVLGPELETMPRAGDTSVDDAAFAEWSVLMRADIGDGRNPVTISENGDPFAVKGDDARLMVGNRIDGNGFDVVALGVGAPVEVRNELLDP